jgi:DNA-binding MarR family transcriptional regulator
MHAVMLSSGAMTNRIDRLETAGLVKREPDSSDRRGLQIALTSKGLELMNWAIEARLEDAEDVVQLINHRDRPSLEPLLRKLIGGIAGDSQSRR